MICPGVRVFVSTAHVFAPWSFDATAQFLGQPHNLLNECSSNQLFNCQEGQSDSDSFLAVSNADEDYSR